MKVRFADDNRNYAQRRDDQLKAFKRKLFWANIYQQLPALLGMAAFLLMGIVIVSIATLV